jgi:hypothetical protein
MSQINSMILSVLISGGLIILAQVPTASAEDRRGRQVDVGGGFFDRGGETRDSVQPETEASGPTDYDKYGNEIKPQRQFDREAAVEVDGAINDTSGMFALPSKAKTPRADDEAVRDGQEKVQAAVKEVEKEFGKIKLPPEAQKRH